jgi:hypothetical protein
VTPLIVVAAGALALVAGLLLVRSFGAAGRIGRIVASTRAVPIARAIELAAGPDAPYLRVDGRVDADEVFEDDAHRPLVLRTSRLEVQVDGRWRTIDGKRETVPFGVTETGHAIAVDVAALDEGLAVVPREALGTVADLARRVDPAVLAGYPADAPARYTIHQVSAVEHSAVFGVPFIGPDGQARIGPGRGRPLVLTTLETDEAIRLLGGGRKWRAGTAIGLLGGGLAVLMVGLAWAAVEAIAG